MIDEIPKPKEWPDGVNLGFTNIQLLGRESKLIGLRERRLWIIDIKEGVVSKMVDLSNTLNNEGILSQSPFAFDVDSLLFFEQYERKLVSLNWKTEKVESTTHFPVRGKESFSQWQGPIVEGDNCFLLDRFGTLFIFERT